jgi:hypothetical protein
MHLTRTVQAPRLFLPLPELRLGITDQRQGIAVPSHAACMPGTSASCGHAQCASALRALAANNHVSDCDMGSGDSTAAVCPGLLA